MARSGLLMLLLFLCPTAVPAATVEAGPGDYRERLSQLEPGDRLVLRAGTYRQGLPVHDLQGTAEAPITIRGPRQGPPARVMGRRGHNIVSLVDAAHVRIAHLVLDGRGLAVDGVKAEGHSRYAHHINLENLTIQNLARHQQIVGISTKCPAWDWVIRGNHIRNAGTGIYLGDSDGSAPFIGGLIEGNRVTGSMGYALQIKHQTRRPDGLGLPRAPRDTVIRYNVLAKDAGSATGAMARPNLLVGHFPAEGPGARDRYLIYGNFLVNNPTEALFQGEGRLAFYNNVLINPAGPGAVVQPHKGIPRAVWLFHNTVITQDAGITLRAAPGTRIQKVVANAIFSPRPIRAPSAHVADNSVAPTVAVPRYLPGAAGDPLQGMFCPRGEALRGKRVAGGLMKQFPHAAQDFAGRPRAGIYRGAFAGRGDREACRVGLSGETLPLRRARRH